MRTYKTAEIAANILIQFDYFTGYRYFPVLIDS